MQEGSIRLKLTNVGIGIKRIKIITMATKFKISRTKRIKIAENYQIKPNR